MGNPWSVLTTPNPPGSYTSVLLGVSCTSAAACTAAGHYSTGYSGLDMTLVERWDGRTWSVHHPEPGYLQPPVGSILHVAQSVIAVGYSYTAATRDKSCIGQCAQRW